jgi:hypothetical protein
MPVLEDVKKVAEKMTGWSRRSGDELTGLDWPPRIGDLLKEVLADVEIVEDLRFKRRADGFGAKSRT